MPTTVIHGRSAFEPMRMRPPIGSRSPKYSFASVSLIIATGGVSVVSLAVNVRPRTSRSPSASSAPSLTICQSPFAKLPGVSTNPSTSRPQSPIVFASGSERISPAVFTSGSARTRSSSR